jgi:hypothetical protein
MNTKQAVSNKGGASSVNSELKVDDQLNRLKIDEFNNSDTGSA